MLIGVMPWNHELWPALAMGYFGTQGPRNSADINADADESLV
jgi:hypothetical protein